MPFFGGQGRLWDRSAPLLRAKCRPQSAQGRVGVCVHSTRRPDTHSVLPGGRSARRPIRARTSSRKRAQSARRSSETNSPEGSDSPAGALSGCCSGSRNHSPPPVETVDNSCVCEPQALRAQGSQAATSRRDSTRSRQARQLPKRSGRPDLRGGAVELSVHDDSLKAGAGRERLPLDARGTFGERLPLPRL